tara:strand:- start:464 stop:976 length:513 start_codon:yes stop_codon:yes gene_type:complete
MEYKDVELNKKLIRVFKNGNVHLFKTKNGEYTTPFDNPSGYKTYRKKTKSYYIRIQINRKKYYAHRIVAFAFLGLDIKNTKLQVDHNNHDTENNSVENLDVCTGSQNKQNRRNIKGYWLNKKTQKYEAHIRINNKRIYGGSYDTEEEAHARYLELKMIHHDYYRYVICSH